MDYKHHTHKRSSSQWVPPSSKNPLDMMKVRNQREKGSRMIKPNHMYNQPRYELNNYKSYKNNAITTTKYSLLTFFPANILHQLKTKYANIYFILLAVMNWFPLFSAYTKYVAFIPICFVLGTTMIKDGVEDLRRWKFDKRINTKNCHVWDRDRQMFRKTQWKYILVGDFVHVSNEEDIPADILFLRSSDPNGTCFVETSNLDGETSLKQRVVPRRYLEFSEENSEFVPSKFNGTVLCEKPDKAIYRIRAKVEDEGNCEILVKENMVLRGSRLRNTTFIEGIVIYAGHDTKVMMNNGRAPHKISGIEKLTNKFIIICFVMLFLMCLGGAIGSALWVNTYTDRTEWVPFIIWNIPKPAIEGLINVGTFIICYQVIVPISLYITVELIKIAQIFFISQDIDLYDQATDRRIDCRSLNIPEELGQVTHILSDKTGTLTENVMIFRNCAIDGVDYGGEFDPEKLDPFSPVLSPSLEIRVQSSFSTDQILKHFFLNIVLNNSVVVNKKPHQDVIEVGYFENGLYNIGNSAFYDVSLDQFKKMVARTKVAPVPDIAPLEFQIESSRGSLTDIPECDERIESETSTPISPRLSRPNVLPPFDSSPPITSTPLLSTPMSRVSSFSRGFRSAMKRAITPISNLLPSPRTSVRARSKTILPEETFSPFEAESPDELALIQGAVLYGVKLTDRSATHVTITLPDSTVQRKTILLTLPFDSARKRMSVIVDSTRGPILYCKGADSAILPRQRNDATEVSQRRHIENHINTYSSRGLRTLCFAMRRLSRYEYEEFRDSYMFLMQDTSNDRESMLSEKADEIEKELQLLGATGIEDRLQDGVNETITSMRAAGIQVWVLTGDKLETAQNIALASGLFDITKPVRIIDKIEDAEQVEKEEAECNIILSPEAIRFAREGDATMIQVLQRASSVLCYRMTPSEKSQIVESVKKHLHGNVLSIGDGANDVPMIQAAHVGIGVAGKEGMQAVMACDFAIARFRFLKKLLLVHGHWSYDRLALSFLYFLYKNTNCVFILFFFQLFDGYSGAYTMDPTYSVIYPIIFTSLQPILVGVYEQDRPAHELLLDPYLYTPGREGRLYTTWLFTLSVIDGIWQAAVVYFVAHLTLIGEDCGLWTFGFYLATGMLLVNCAHLALEIRYWTAVLAGIFIFFIFLHFGYFWLLGLIVPAGTIPDAPVEVASDNMSTGRFWAAIIIMTVIALFPRFATHAVTNTMNRARESYGKKIDD